jgi:choline dehydrogenase
MAVQLTRITHNRCFSHPNDMAVMVRAIRLALRIGRSEPLVGQLELKPHSTDKEDVFWPGDADPDVITDDEIEAFIRRNAETNYHPVSDVAALYPHFLLVLSI